MTTGVAIPGGSGPLSIRNLLCGGDVHGNALGRWSMLALPELPACCLVICLSHTATGRFLLRMSGARTDEPGVKRRGLRAGGLIGLAVGGKQGCDRRRHLVVGRGHDTRRLDAAAAVAAPNVEPRTTRSVAAESNASGAAITNDTCHLPPGSSAGAHDHYVIGRRH